MAGYSYKRVAFRDDFRAEQERYIEANGECDGDPGYDGDYWVIVADLLDRKDAEIRALRAASNEKLKAALLNLIDEAERIVWAEEDEGRKLPHLSLRVAQARALLEPLSPAAPDAERSDAPDATTARSNVCCVEIENGGPEDWRQMCPGDADLWCPSCKRIQGAKGEP